MNCLPPSELSCKIIFDVINACVTQLHTWNLISKKKRKKKPKSQNLVFSTRWILQQNFFFLYIFHPILSNWIFYLKYPFVECMLSVSRTTMLYLEKFHTNIAQYFPQKNFIWRTYLSYRKETLLAVGTDKHHEFTNTRKAKSVNQSTTDLEVVIERDNVSRERFRVKNVLSLLNDWSSSNTTIECETISMRERTIVFLLGTHALVRKLYAELSLFLEKAKAFLYWFCKEMKHVDWNYELALFSIT